MAKIIKVGSQNPTFTSQKIANPFRTSRNSTTNPFKYNNFEGNTLPFELAADVFEGVKPSFKGSKLRMVAASVTGSMTKMKNSITEPIVNFARRVGNGISSAWAYAKETPISEVPGFKQVHEAMGVMSSRINDRISGIQERVSTSISSRIEIINNGISGMNQELRSQWESIIAKIPSRTRYTAETPVSELESAWREIISLEGGIA